MQTRFECAITLATLGTIRTAMQHIFHLLYKQPATRCQYICFGL